MKSLVGQSLGRYHVLEQLGEGGMAVVYKAFDTRLERQVAIKIIRRDAFPPEQLEMVLKRFEREAKSLARLSHPNIVKVLDYGEYEGSPFLVLEYLPGGTLKGHMGRALAWPEAVRLLLPVARALAYAHQQAIIHRDVKPANVLMTESDEPMLTDFGIAKLLEGDDSQTLTGTGVGIGTPEYMAPEQWLGKATAKSDQYSLGVIFYEMVTGRKPFVADTPAAVLLKQTNDPLPSPRSIVSDLDKDAEKFIFKVLARNPEDRYPSMVEVVGELKKLSSLGESHPRSQNVEPVDHLPATSFDTKVDVPPVPIFSNPPPIILPEAKKKGNRKNRWWIGIAAAVGLVLVGLVVWGLLGGGPFHFYASPNSEVEISNQSCDTKNIYIDGLFYGTISPYSTLTLVVKNREHKYLICETGSMNCESLLTQGTKVVIPYRSACN